jgi:hypothetical protein
VSPVRRLPSAHPNDAAAAVVVDNNAAAIVPGELNHPPRRLNGLGRPLCPERSPKYSVDYSEKIENIYFSSKCKNVPLKFPAIRHQQLH